MMHNVSLKVFDVWHTDKAELILPVNEADFEKLTFDGRPLQKTWIPISVRRVPDTERRKRQVEVDFPAGSVGDLLLNRRVVNSIGDYLSQYGELLPLACSDRELWTLNVTCFVDALDESQSRVIRATDEDRILMIDKYVLYSELVANKGLFRLPQFARDAILVTNSFMDLVTVHGLTGLKFRQIWAPN